MINISVRVLIITYKKNLVVLSLFDGMSCGQLALRKNDIPIKNYLASEIKPHAIEITQANFPATIQLGNVQNIHYADGFLYTETQKIYVGEVDLFMGGSPCQNFSIACATEKREGLKGEKSSLFYEYLRLLKEVNPKYFLLENVGSMKKDDKKQLDSYMGVEGFVINSEAVSPQLRKRIYWTNIPQDENHLPLNDIQLSDILENGYTNRKKARCLLESDSRPLKNTLKMFHRYYGTGFGNVIFKSEQHYKDCLSHYTKFFEDKSAKEIDELSIGMDLSVYDGLRQLTQTELERCQTVPVGYTKSISRNKAASLLGDGWTVDVIAHLLKPLKNII